MIERICISRKEVSEGYSSGDLNKLTNADTSDDEIRNIINTISNKTFFERALSASTPLHIRKIFPYIPATKLKFTLLGLSKEQLWEIYANMTPLQTAAVVYQMADREIEMWLEYIAQLAPETRSKIIADTLPHFRDFFLPRLIKLAYAQEITSTLIRGRQSYVTLLVPALNISQVHWLFSSDLSFTMLKEAYKALSEVHRKELLGDLEGKTAEDLGKIWLSGAHIAVGMNHGTTLRTMLEIVEIFNSSLVYVCMALMPPPCIGSLVTKVSANVLIPVMEQLEGWKVTTVLSFCGVVKLKKLLPHITESQLMASARDLSFATLRELISWMTPAQLRAIASAGGISERQAQELLRHKLRDFFAFEAGEGWSTVLAKLESNFAGHVGGFDQVMLIIGMRDAAFRKLVLLHAKRLSAEQLILIVPRLSKVEFGELLSSLDEVRAKEMVAAT